MPRSILPASARLGICTLLGLATLVVAACQPAAPAAPTATPAAAPKPTTALAPTTAPAPTAAPAKATTPPVAAQAATAPVSAADTGVLAQVKSRGVLRVANPQTSPPYSLRDEKNELVGFDVDMANELVKRMGIPRVEFIQGTFETFIPGVQTDKWDIVIAGQAITEERKHQVDFSIPYRVSGVSIFVNQADTAIKTLDDLKGKRIAIPAGAAQLKMAQGVPNAEIKSYENATLALADVGLGRADGYLGSRFVGLYLAEKNNLKVKPTEAVLEIEQNAMSFKKGEAALKAAVDQAIRSMAADGTLTAISKKWFGPSEDMAAEIRKLGVL